MPDGDILFRAEVDDRTLEFYQRFDENLEKMARNSEEGFKRVDDSVKRSAKTTSLLTSALTTINQKLLQLASAGVNFLKNYIVGATQLTSRVDVLGTVLETVAEKNGITREEMQAAEEGIKSMGITTAATRQSMLLMARANIDWAEGAKLARVAQDAAVVAGLNSSQAFERLVRGVQKMEPEMLDELGITLNREQAYKALATTLNKTTKELTTAEKQQAILNDIYRQSGVVAGSYEAAMGDVGKQVTSLPRHMEELQLAVGRAFQPAYGLQVEFMTEKLKELRAWVDENQERIQAFGEGFVRAMSMVIEFSEKVLGAISAIPQKIENAGIALAKFFSTMDDAQVEQQAAQHVTLERFGQGISILVGIIAAGVQTVISAMETLALAISIPLAGIADILNIGDFSAKQQIDKLKTQVSEFGQTSVDAFDKWFVATAEVFGLIKDEAPEVAEELENVASTANSAAEDAAMLAASINQINETMEEFKQKMLDDIEARAIKELRRQIEEDLQNSFKIEDIERRHAERLAEITKDGIEKRDDLGNEYAKGVLKLQQDTVDKAIKIEEDYQKKLRDMEEDFHFEAEELARSRDAIGILRLMRQNERALEQEREAVEERRQINQESFEEQLDDLNTRLAEQQAALEQNIQDQIASLNEQRQKEYDNLARSLDRQRQVRELHEEWAREDRIKRYDEELREMAEQFMQLEGITAEGLDEILGEWDDFFDDLSALRDEAYAIQAEIAEATAQSVAAATALPVGGIMGLPNDPDAPGFFGQTVRGTSTGDPIDPMFLPQGPSVFGQAGQVSSLLTGLMAGQMAEGGVSRLPAASPSSSYNRREILVKAEGFSPEIERTVVRALLEIERNR